MNEHQDDLCQCPWHLEQRRQVAEHDRLTNDIGECSNVVLGED